MLITMTQETVAFENQVAGHDTLMRLDVGRIMKPSVRLEVEFYERAQGLTKLLAYLPKYYGTVDNPKLNSPAAFSRCVVLEDATSDFKQASIVDLKLGVRLYDDFATEEKRERMIHHAMNTTSHATGIRLCGAKVYDRNLKTYRAYSRDFGRQLRTVDMYGALRSLFCSAAQPAKGCTTAQVAGISALAVSSKLLSSIRQQLDGLFKVVAELDCSLYSSSILLIYGTRKDTGDVDARICMIDFAHSVIYSQQPKRPVIRVDELFAQLGSMPPFLVNDGSEIFKDFPNLGYLFGVHNLLRLMDSLLDELRNFEKEEQSRKVK